MFINLYNFQYELFDKKGILRVPRRRSKWRLAWRAFLRWSLHNWKSVVVQVWHPRVELRSASAFCSWKLGSEKGGRTVLPAGRWGGWSSLLILSFHNRSFVRWRWFSILCLRVLINYSQAHFDARTCGDAEFSWGCNVLICGIICSGERRICEARGET